MMTCLEKNELLNYLRGELKKDRAREVKAHLDLCKGCSKKLDQLAALMKLDYVLESEKRRPYEGECIPKFLLLQYVVELVDERDKKAQITRHIFHCKECKRVYYSYLQVYEEVKACFEMLKDKLATQLKWGQERIRDLFRVPVEIFLSPKLKPISVTEEVRLPILSYRGITRGVRKGITRELELIFPLNSAIVIDKEGLLFKWRCTVEGVKVYKLEIYDDSEGPIWEEIVGSKLPEISFKCPDKIVNRLDRNKWYGWQVMPIIEKLPLSGFAAGATFKLIGKKEMQIANSSQENEFLTGIIYEKMELYHDALDIYDKIDSNNKNGIILGRKIEIYKKMGRSMGRSVDEIIKLEKRYKEIMQLENS